MERYDLYRMAHLTGVAETFAQDALGAGMTFAATGSDAEFLAQFGHGTYACIDGLLNLAFGNVIANTDDHGMLCGNSLSRPLRPG
jgi:hypothetical protein